MKKELKYFLLGIASTILAIGLIFGGYTLFIKLKNKNKEVIIDGYVYESQDWANQNIVCSSIKNIRTYIGGYNNRIVLTNDGYLYEFNVSQLYSETNENCRKMSDIKFSKIINDNLVAENGDIYSISSTDDNTNGLAKSNYIMPDYFKSNDILYSERTSSNFNWGSGPVETTDTYAVLKSDGKVNEVVIDKLGECNETGECKTSYNVTNEKVMYSFEGEKIKYFKASDTNSYIVTDKAIYLPEATNPDCKKYADVECNYELKKNKYFTGRYDDVLVITGLDNYDELQVWYYDKDLKYTLVNIQKKN